MTAGQVGVWSLRSAGSADAAFLQQMLYEALYVPEGEESFPASVLEEPRLRRYFDGFGDQPGDIGAVALDDQRRVGACWLRTFSPAAPGYGWVEVGVPELTIAVMEEARGQGLGTALIRAVMEAASERGAERVSLSVDPRSPALRLYERLGFVPVGHEDTSITMIRDTESD